MELSDLNATARSQDTIPSMSDQIHLPDLGQHPESLSPTYTPPRPGSPMLLASADHIDADADEHLLPQPSPGFLPRSLTARLYTSHFLSTWNSRLFEFGAVLFLADIFPSSLLPLSVYALMRSAAVILGAQAVGEVVDRAAKSVGKKGRLEVVRSSIVGGRVAVVGSCGILLLLGKIKSGGKDAGGLWTGSMGGSAPVLGLFVVLIVLACVEKLCATMNLVAVERDWVVVMTDGNDAARQCKWRSCALGVRASLLT